MVVSHDYYGYCTSDWCVDVCVINENFVSVYNTAIDFVNRDMMYAGLFLMFSDIKIVFDGIMFYVFASIICGILWRNKLV